MVGDAGVLVPPRDPESMAAAIERLLDDADLRKQCAGAGPRIVASSFRLDRQIDVLIDVLVGTVGAQAR